MSPASNSFVVDSETSLTPPCSMSIAQETRRCPFCRESIATTASRCKHCHADLDDLTRKRPAFIKKINTFRVGFLCGILFSALMTILIYFQFYSGE